MTIEILKYEKDKIESVSITLIKLTSDYDFTNVLNEIKKGILGRSIIKLEINKHE